MSKYRNRKVEYDGHTFDSKKECAFYKKLLADERVERIELQPRFTLIPSREQVWHETNPKTGRQNKKKRTIRGVTYIADFRVFYKGHKEKVYDVKGMRTDVYKLKKKMLEYFHPHIDFEEV